MFYVNLYNEALPVLQSATATATATFAAAAAAKRTATIAVGIWPCALVLRVTSADVDAANVGVDLLAKRL